MTNYTLTSWRRTALVLALTGGALLAATHEVATAATTPANAGMHLGLKRAEPGANDTVSASPATLKLWFTQSVQAAGTSLRVTGAADHIVAIGDVSVEKAELSPAVVKVNETLKPGTYVVAWRTMAADGHPATGKFSFTVRAATETH
jgi:methionine-rich copper-binding protein CopC